MGKKDRALWLNDEALEWLRKWRERQPVQTMLLFTTLVGAPLRDNYQRAEVTSPIVTLSPSQASRGPFQDVVRE